ncbi:methyl-accepting chemotaxis protein [Paenibacillus sp. KN14-4R]|uniref:methyl-accepting chemotaxis protein n=1 Tax=Paenibacillus sp. KN14-4R TaxID=3445773 RepID=UPI003FA0029C
MRIMNLLKNLKVSVKIYLLLGLSLVFMAIISIASYISIQSIGNNSKAMYLEKLVPNDLISKILYNNAKIDYFELELRSLTETAKKQASLQKIDAHIADSQEAQKQFEALPMTDRVKEQMDIYKAKLEASQVQIKKYNDMSLQNKEDIAYALFSTNVQPLRNEMIKALTTITQYNQEDAKAFYESNKDDLQRSSIWSVIIWCLCLAICIVTGYFIIQIIKKPIHEIEALMKKAQQGDLTIRGTYVSDDELGKLTNDFNLMIDAQREIITNISTNAETLSASTEEMLAGAQQSAVVYKQVASDVHQVSEGANLQLLNAQESVRSMEEVAIGIQRIAEFSSNVLESSVDAAHKANEGNTSIQQAIEQMAAIRAAVYESSTVVKQLGNRTNEIGKIVQVISNIATQTNLLALNAAIEAARAGEHGKGFAVVANEVRQLAEQSSQSAKEIVSLIQSIQKDSNQAAVTMTRGNQVVDAGTSIMEEVGHAFEDILQRVEHVANQMQEVSAASEEMSASSEQITASLHQMESISVQSNSSIKNVAEASESQLAMLDEVNSALTEMAQMAQNLQEMTTRFKTNK